MAKRHKPFFFLPTPVPTQNMKISGNGWQAKYMYNKLAARLALIRQLIPGVTWAYVVAVVWMLACTILSKISQPTAAFRFSGHT